MFAKSVKRTSVLLIVWLLFAPTAHATKLAGEFLATGFGARALGMGGAFASIADDASAVYWNPAGLIQLEQSQILFMHSERFGNLVDYNCFSLARPLSRNTGEETTGAITIIWLRVSDIAFTSHLTEPGVDFIDANGNGKWDPEEGERRLWRPDRVRWESDNEVAGYLSYSRRFSPKIAAGLNAKVIWKEIADITSLGFGLDVGVLYEIMTNWMLGLNLQDFTGTPLYWDGWYCTDYECDERYKVSTKETIYPTIKVGSSYTLPVPSISGKVVFAGDCDFKFEGLAIEEADFWSGDISADIRMGILYEYKEVLRLAAGMDRRKPSAGVGLHVGQFNLDYAFWRDTEIDNTHRISVSMDF